MSDKYEISEISYLSAGAEIFSLPVKKTLVPITSNLQTHA